MAGAACKVIINNTTQALSRSLETILTNPDIHGGMIPERDRKTMLQSLADIDILAFTGVYNAPGTPLGLLDIVLKLETCGLITDDVWKVLPRPARAGVGNGGIKKR